LLHDVATNRLVHAATFYEQAVHELDVDTKKYPVAHAVIVPLAHVDPPVPQATHEPELK